jgi:hypothetical protein
MKYPFISGHQILRQGLLQGILSQFTCDEARQTSERDADAQNPSTTRLTTSGSTPSDEGANEEGLTEEEEISEPPVIDPEGTQATKREYTPQERAKFPWVSKNPHLQRALLDAILIDFDKTIELEEGMVVLPLHDPIYRDSVSEEFGWPLGLSLDELYSRTVRLRLLGESGVR